MTSLNIRTASQGLGLVTTEPTRRAPDEGVGDYLGQLANVAKETANLVRQTESNRAELEATRAFNRASFDVQTLVQDLENDTDYGTQFERYTERVKEIAQGYQEGITNDQARARFNQQFGVFALKEGIGVRGTSIEKHLDVQRGLADQNLDQLSAASGNVVDAEDRAELRKMGLAEIQRNHDIGVYDELEAAEALARFENNNAKAYVRREIRISPEEALVKLQNNEYKGLSAEENQIWQERAVRAHEANLRERVAAQDRREREEEQAEKDRFDQFSQQGDVLLRQGQLTESWIIDNLDNLSEEDRRYFFRKLDEGLGTQGNSDVYGDLRQAAMGRDVSDEARDALRSNQISEAQYDKLISRSQAFAPEAAIPNPMKRAENKIFTALTPPENFTDPLAKLRQSEAVDELFTWFESNKNATDQEISKRADELIGEYSIVDTRAILQQTRNKTGLPINPTVEDVRAEMQDAVNRFTAGELTREQFDKLASQLKKAEESLINDTVPR